MEQSARIAGLAAIFSDPSRISILSLLVQDREGLSTLDICTRLGLPQPRVSSHLSLLLRHGAVTVTRKGRQRVYALGSDRVASILEDLAAFYSPTKRARLLSRGEPASIPKASSEIRLGRTCYDHLAGVMGVQLLKEMEKAGWLSEKRASSFSKPVYRLTDSGSEALQKRGVDLEAAKKSSRIFAYGCLDWTENEPHLGGSLGNAILNSLFASRIVERKKGTRALKVLEPISCWIEDPSRSR